MENTGKVKPAASFLSPLFVSFVTTFSVYLLFSMYLCTVDNYINHNFEPQVIRNLLSSSNYINALTSFITSNSFACQLQINKYVKTCVCT